MFVGEEEEAHAGEEEAHFDEAAPADGTPAPEAEHEEEPASAEPTPASASASAPAPTPATNGSVKTAVQIVAPSQSMVADETAAKYGGEPVVSIQWMSVIRLLVFACLARRGCRKPAGGALVLQCYQHGFVWETGGSCACFIYCFVYCFVTDSYRRRLQHIT